MSYYKFPSLDDTVIFHEDTVGDSFVCILVEIWLFSPKIPCTSFFFGGVEFLITEISSGRFTSTGALSIKRYTQKTNTFKEGECIFTSTHQFLFFFKYIKVLGNYYSRKDGISLYRKIYTTERCNAINKYTIKRKIRLHICFLVELWWIH